MPAKKGKDKEDQIEYTVFQKDAKLSGVLKFKKPLKIHGHFSGDIEGNSTLFLGSNSVLEANLKIRSLILEGKLTGNVVASEKAELRRGATLVGDIKVPKLEISEGVVFDGQCEMQTEKKNIP